MLDIVNTFLYRIFLCFSVKPLSVTILSSEHSPLSAGRKYDINCMTVGSRPPAKLSWYMDGRKLTNYTEKVLLLFIIYHRKF